jgi:hypothetical protein
MLRATGCSTEIRVSVNVRFLSVSRVQILLTKSTPWPAPINKKAKLHRGAAYFKLCPAVDKQCTVACANA